MPTDNTKNRVAESVKSAFGTPPELQDDPGPSFFQRVLDALRGSESLSSKINSAIQKRQDK